MKNIVIALSCIFYSLPVSAQSCGEIFATIYRTHEWGKNRDNSGSSGSGSSVANSAIYRTYLQDFLSARGIRSVVDLGCGDWNFSRLIDWRGITYIGIDIVPELIKKNQRQYGTKNITFLHIDALNTELPAADLLVCKDVLQHLPNASILGLIPQFKKYKYCLLTDNMDVIQNNVLYTTFHPINGDIARFGLCRPIDLTLPPFNVQGRSVLKYISTSFIMQTILIDNTL